MQTVLFKEIRLRIATRRDEQREATRQEVMTVANDTKNRFRGTVTEEDVLRAYERGEEVSVIVRFAPFIILTMALIRGCAHG